MSDSDPHFAEPDTLSGFEQDRRARMTLVRVLRVIVLLLMGAVTLLTVLQISEDPEGSAGVIKNWETALLVAIGLAAGVIAIDVFTPVKKISTIGGVFLGLLAGILGAVAVGFVIELIVETYDLEANRIIGGVKVLVGIALCYLGVTVVLQTQDDFRLLIPYVEFAKQIRGVRPMVVDTSALIDGRLDAIGETGFLLAPLIIPRFVIGELQLLSDSSDKLKRARGRRGLEMVTLLQRNPHLDLTIEDVAVSGKNVDAMIVEHARETGAGILTTDTGLARVASIQGVQAMNLNDLAAALKPSVLPGESLELELVRAGEQHGQAVGYLDDGTMVVAENAAHLIGSRIPLTVTSSLQTSAGRMIFARPSGDAPRSDEAPGANEPDRENDDAPASPDASDESASSKPGPGPSRRPDPRRAARRNPRRG